MYPRDLPAHAPPPLTQIAHQFSTLMGNLPTHALAICMLMSTHVLQYRILALIVAHLHALPVLSRDKAYTCLPMRTQFPTEWAFIPLNVLFVEYSVPYLGYGHAQLCCLVRYLGQGSRVQPTAALAIRSPSGSLLIASRLAFPTLEGFDR